MTVLGHVRGVEAVAVVLDDEPDLLGGGDEPDAYMLGSRVPDDVGESFLADTVQGYLDARRERATAVHRLVTRADACLRSPFLYQGFQRLGERASFERGGPEIQHRAPGFFEVGLGEGERLAEGFSGFVRRG